MEQYETQIRELVLQGITHSNIGDMLQHANPNVRGFSERSVRRFCQQHDISYRSNLTDIELSDTVHGAVQHLGHSYGRRMMHGVLAARDIHVSQARIAAALHHVAPNQYSARRYGVTQRHNPTPYRASYCGEKLHCDQNEKLNMYGVTHVLAIDGFSRKIIRCITLPVKNPIAIYDLLFRPILIQEGLWDQVRVDHGTEFNLMLAVQNELASYRVQQDHLPYVQSTSRLNHRVERFWPDVNQRVNYPIKEKLIEMEATDEIEMRNPLTKFCVSWVTIQVASIGLIEFIQSWNAHRMDGLRGGIPNKLATEHYRVTSLPYTAVPTTATAVAMYENNGAGRLSKESHFGTDPIAQYPRLQDLRLRDFKVEYPSWDAIYDNISSGDGEEFKKAVKFFIELSEKFSDVV